MSNKVGRPVKFTREALKVEREKILALLLDGKTLDQIFPLMGYGTRGAMCYHHPRVLRNALMKRKLKRTGVNPEKQNHENEI